MISLEHYDRLSTLYFKLDNGVSLLYVLYDCMEENAYSAGTLAPALHAVCDYLNDLRGELELLKSEIRTEGRLPYHPLKTNN